MPNFDWPGLNINISVVLHCQATFSSTHIKVGCHRFTFTSPHVLSLLLTQLHVSWPRTAITPLHSSLSLFPQQHDHWIIPKPMLSLYLPQAAELARENPTITITRHMLRSCPKSSKGAQHHPVTLRDTKKFVQRQKSHQGNDGRNPRTKETYWCLVQNCLSIADHS